MRTLIHRVVPPCNVTVATDMRYVRQSYNITHEDWFLRRVYDEPQLREGTQSPDKSTDSPASASPGLT
jgi:hypothetical protein